MKINDPVKTWSWGRWLKGQVSHVNGDGTVTVEWHGGGVSLGATPNKHGIIPRR